MEPTEFVYTVGMDEEEISERLAENETGVLSLADGGRAYAVPVSYRYEDGTIYVRLADDGDSEKLAYLDATREACLVLYDAAPLDESWSVVVTGRLVDVTEAFVDGAEVDRVTDAFDPLRVFDESIDDVTVRVYEFEVFSETGRKVAR